MQAQSGRTALSLHLQRCRGEYRGRIHVPYPATQHVSLLTIRGGWRKSGVGREMGPQALAPFMEVKSCVSYNDRAPIDWFHVRMKE